MRKMLRSRPPTRRRAFLGLLWVTAVHAAGLYLFTTGFFLTRFEVPDVSECRVAPDQPSASRLRSADDSARAGESGCWMPRRFRRVVLVVVDALRFDFVRSAPSSALTSSFYLNHLPIINATLHAQPQNALLLKFVADPPTMTMQRLKGLTTGSLPTFLDIKDNMASIEITEDNLLQQMQRAQRPVVFMGDDTWDALYGKRFTRKYSYDSFNVKDLHSVDRGVVKHLFPELRADDWDLLIAHFLGVDHVGHTHGPSSPFMAEKLDEMNGILARLLDELAQDEAEDTLLLVMGDHGMSADGNHGGASDEETGAALFAFSKKPIVDDANGRQWPQEVPQVDLVPTVALLAGLPIPFGSLGAVIPQFFVDRDSLTEALRLNVEQVRRYLLTYSTASKLPQSAFDHLERIYNNIKVLQGSADRADELVELHFEYLREALALGRSIWTQFDLCGMAWGIVLLLFGQGTVLWCVLGPEELDRLLNLRAVIGAFIGCVLGAIVPTPMIILPQSRTSRVIGFGVFVSYIAAIGFERRTRATARPINFSNSSSGFAFATVLLHSLALLSNSYIAAEDRVMQFLSATTGCFMLWFSQRHAPRSARTRAVAAAVLFALVSRFLGAIESPNIIRSESSLLRTWLPLVLAAFAASIAPLTLGLPPSVPMAAAVVWSVVACGCYWYWPPTTMAPLWRLWLPRSVFLITLAGIGRRAWLSPRTQVGDSVASTALLLLALSLVLGPTSPLTTVSIALQHGSFAAVARLCFPQRDLPLSWVLLWCAACYHSFFVTGHQNTFTSLQNAAGFVGFDDFRFYWAGALLGLNTFGVYALALVGVLPLMSRSSPPWETLLTVVAYFGLNALVSTVFVALQRRHLMVWAIFAPKFIFDGATLLAMELLSMVTIASVAISPAK